jgi:hypothetical protein
MVDLYTLKVVEQSTAFGRALDIWIHRSRETSGGRDADEDPLTITGVGPTQLGASTKLIECNRRLTTLKKNIYHIMYGRDRDYCPVKDIEVLEEGRSCLLFRIIREDNGPTPDRRGDEIVTLFEVAEKTTPGLLGTNSKDVLDTIRSFFRKQHSPTAQETNTPDGNSTTVGGARLRKPQRRQSAGARTQSGAQESSTAKVCHTTISPADWSSTPGHTPDGGVVRTSAACRFGLEPQNNTSRYASFFAVLMCYKLKNNGSAASAEPQRRC